MTKKTAVAAIADAITVGVVEQQTSEYVISSSNLAIADLEVAKQRLTDLDISLDLLKVDDIAATLADMIIVLSDDVENHLVTVVGQKKASGIDATTKIPDITVGYLIECLATAVDLLARLQSFGNTRLTVRNMKGIRVASEKIKELTGQLMVQSVLYKVRNR